MDKWRQEKLSCISKALGNIDHRAGKLANQINGAPVGTWHSDNKVRVVQRSLSPSWIRKPCLNQFD